MGLVLQGWRGVPRTFLELALEGLLPLESMGIKGSFRFMLMRFGLAFERGRSGTLSPNHHQRVIAFWNPGGGEGGLLCFELWTFISCDGWGGAW